MEADARCENLNLMVLGLALLYVYVTGPFWRHINSDTHYLDQYTFIQPLYQHLQKMVSCPDLLITNIPENLISCRQPDSAVVTSVLNTTASLTEENRPLLLSIFKSLAEQFVAVVERQLADFLPGGKYGSEPTEEERLKMQHCQLTNLLGESCFGDLDYSMHKNRGASLHFHSTTNMLKRNRPISGWLSNKSSHEKTILIEKSKKLGPDMREAGRNQQRLVMEDLQRNIEAEELEEKRKAEKQFHYKNKLAEDISAQGGLCRTKEDIKKLVDKQKGATNKLNALKLQIRYIKTFLDAKDPRLQLSNISLDDMSKNLSSFLLEHFGPGSSTSIPEAAAEEEEIEDFDEEFTFSCQGQTVAVFYSNDNDDEVFFIGQVLEVVSPEEATVTFMEQRGSTNTFKWPGSDSIENIKSKFVFCWNFNLIPQNRTWALPEGEWVELQRKWRQYIKTFCY